MSQPLVLSLFPGIGLLDRAFEEEGFCVVRGPDVLWGGDVHRFHPPRDRFDGVIGGPPCQHWSRLRHIVEHNGYQIAPDLIPEFVRCVLEAQPKWYLMENVPGAPPPVVDGYNGHRQLVRDVWVGGLTMRKRAITFGRPPGAGGWLNIEQVALHTQEPELSPMASGGSGVHVRLRGGSLKEKSSSRKDRSRLSNNGYKTRGNLREALRLQGLPEDFLEDAPFTVAGKLEVVGNGVPLPMGRAIAKGVRRAMYPETTEASA